MNRKPKDIRKDEKIEFRISQRDKDFILEKTKSKDCSIGDLVVDSVRAEYERRTRREKERMRLMVVMENLKNIVRRKAGFGESCESELKSLKELEDMLWRF